jgi:hypothetical protein
VPERNAETSEPLRYHQLGLVALVDDGPTPAGRIGLSVIRGGLP